MQRLTELPEALIFMHKSSINVTVLKKTDKNIFQSCKDFLELIFFQLRLVQPQEMVLIQHNKKSYSICHYG